MATSLVSIVIPCYNHEKFVQDCIQSVIDQTYANIELIIIDDGSKDCSVKKIQEMIPKCEERFVRFEFRKCTNKGLSATLNEAIEWCEGEYYSAIASDDMMLPEKTAKQVELLGRCLSYVASFGAYQLIDENNIKKAIFKQSDRDFDFDLLMYTDLYLPAPTQMIRLHVLKNTGGYKEGMIIEDWYMWLKLLEKPNSKIAYRDEIYAYYRNHGNNTFSNPYKMSLGYLQVLNEFNTHPKFKKAFIKANWENIFLLLRQDFKLTSKIFFERLRIKISKFF